MIKQEKFDALGRAGLRLTAPRLAICQCLFGDSEHRHVTAEDIHAETAKMNANMSLATVYNTLHSFTEAGLLREVVVDPARIWFCTNMNEHHHLYDEDTGQITDISVTDVEHISLPKIHGSKQIKSVDLVIRVCNKPN